MNSSLRILTLALLLTGCGHERDGELRERLLGSWDWATADGRWISRTTYEPTGRYTTRFVKRTESGVTQTNTQVGAFQIVDGTLIETLTNYSMAGQITTNVVLSDTTRMRIIRIDDRDFVFNYEAKDLPEGHTPAPTNEVRLRRAAR